MATQGPVTLVDHEWRLLGNGPNVAIATQNTGVFYVVLAASQPVPTTEKDDAFFGRAGQPVSYAGLDVSDQVWGISGSGDLKVSVAKS